MASGNGGNFSWPIVLQFCLLDGLHGQLGVAELGHRLEAIALQQLQRRRHQLLLHLGRPEDVPDIVWDGV